MGRVIFSRRWIGRHVLVLALFVGFLALGWWQYLRAEGGNGRSWGYTFMWPLFALFLIFFWWRMVQMDAAEQAEQDQQDDTPQVQEPTPVASGPVRKELARRQAARARSTTALQEEPDEAMDAYNDYLARLNASAAVAQIEREQARSGSPRARSKGAAS